MTHRDVELTRIIDALLAAQAAAIALDREQLIYLIGLALDEAKAQINH